jgi:hypothetical protein
MPVSPVVAETTEALLVALLGALDRVEWPSGSSFRRARSSWPIA